MLLVQISTEKGPSASGSLQVSYMYHDWLGLFVVEDLPNLAEILQGYVDSRILQRDISDQLEKDHGIRIGYVIFFASSNSCVCLTQTCLST
jgi:hypothetical protein